MPLHRRQLAALAFQSAVAWLLLLATTFAQFNFNSASILEPPPQSFPSQPTAPPPELGAPNFAAPQPYPEFIPTPSPSPSLPNSPLPPWAIPTNPEQLAYRLGGQARGYYINDQRIEFTGVEATFAVEGVLNGGLTQRADDWDLSVETQLFFNQGFGQNIFVDTPTRASFKNNYDIDPLEISQLYLGARHDDFYLALGRFVTPFGRFYFPNYRNNFDDSPFIRSEAILFRETGLLLQWDPGIWVCTAALTNGSFEQDTNSSKAIVARVGIEEPWYALGTSVKWQDGNGSEWQKVFNNHVGVDGMVRFGNWTLSGEAIYDQYGLRRPGVPLNSITWGRSLYFRDLNNGYEIPITGYGYYVNLGYEGPNWSLMLNYGDFFPEKIGDRRQDQPNHRGLIKASRHWTRHFETYAIALLENELPRAFDNVVRGGTYIIAGAQFTW